MSYKLFLSLILTFLCGDIIGQSISGTVTNESNQPIDSVVIIRDSSNRNLTLMLELEEIGVVNNNILPPSLMLPSFMIDEYSFSHGDFGQLPYLNVVSRPTKKEPFYHSRITPFNYHYEDMVEGLDLVGVNINLVSTPIVDLFVSPRISSSYMGPLFPTRINNASLQTNFLINVGDNVRLKFVGRLSAYQGINPLLNPMVGASNYYGGAIQVRLVGNLGVEASVQRNFFMGEWTTSYYVTPIVYK